MPAPFTYLIGWSSYNKWYYGVRWAKNADPSTLWLKYKTSSKYVKDFAKKYGDPDVIQIRKFFKTVDQARIFEQRVLIKLNSLDPFGPNSKWLNQTTNKSIINYIPYERTQEIRQKISEKAKQRIVSDATRKKISLAGKDRKHSEETKIKIGLGNKGKVMSPESIEKARANRKTVSRYWSGKTRSYETKQKISKFRKNKSYFDIYDNETAIKLKEKRRLQKSKPWIIIHPNGETESIINLTDFCLKNNLNPARMVDVANGKQKFHKGFSCRRPLGG